MKFPQFFVTRCLSNRPIVQVLTISLPLLGLTACDILSNQTKQKKMTIEQIAQLMPNRGQDKSSWAGDIQEIFNKLDIPHSKKNFCTTIAVIDQESNFKADPPVDNLGRTSLKALNEKLDEKLGKTLANLFRKMLTEQPSVQNSFEKQILKVKTEQQLDKVYHQMFAYFSEKYYANKITDVTKLVGGDIAEKLDPITTLGSMQVHIDYARDNKRANTNNEELRRDLYSQYGGLYYGIHRLMLYPADYDNPIYRFADYNSGMYSSRNAGFQKMLATISGQKLDYDGDLLIYKKGGSISGDSSQAERAINSLIQKGLITLNTRQVRSDLSKEKSIQFSNTETYRTVSSLYQMKTNKKPIVAMMPEVVISGAKLKKDYNTKWYADNVNYRYQACMGRKI